MERTKIFAIFLIILTILFAVLTLKLDSKTSYVDYDKLELRQSSTYIGIRK